MGRARPPQRHRRRRAAALHFTASGPTLLAGCASRGSGRLVGTVTHRQQRRGADALDRLRRERCLARDTRTSASSSVESAAAAHGHARGMESEVPVSRPSDAAGPRYHATVLHASFLLTATDRVEGQAAEAGTSAGLRVGLRLSGA